MCLKRWQIVCRASLRRFSEVLGIESLTLKKEGDESRTLFIRMKPILPSLKPSFAIFALSELSDGQRLLIVLYALLHFGLEADGLIAIDDPVNFVAIAEVQPWLATLLDRAEATGTQLMLISHHPEILDYLAPDRVVRFDREPAGPIRVRKFASDAASGLRASELVSRGWDNE